jgi:hypothetical protein
MNCEGNGMAIGFDDVKLKYIEIAEAKAMGCFMFLVVGFVFKVCWI